MVEGNHGQESSSQEIIYKIKKHSYQFQRKGNGEQFKFNSAVEEHLKAVELCCMGAENWPSRRGAAMAILSIGLHQQIEFEPEWTPREGNRLYEPDDWMLNPEVFQEFDARWGPHKVDRFADGYNTQLQRFNSCYWH